MTAEPTRRVNDPLTVSSAVVLALAALAAFSLAVTLAPPRSGPNCLTPQCVGYPYTDVAAWAPTEYWWMLPAAVVPLALTASLGGLREPLAGTRRRVGDLAVLLALAATVVLVAAYAIQWRTVQPSLFRGETEHLVLWSQ
ncbi:MAG: hypothetical protein QM286_04770, partial [Acidobacteriota bacterium]|nr:hypothetical protein [Acidobacteriota bacterium]